MVSRRLKVTFRLKSVKPIQFMIFPVDADALRRFHIVLTTYPTLRNEWNLREVQASTGVYPLLDLHWRRVLLGKACLLMLWALID